MNHCNTMRETIQQQQAMIDTYHQQPWLEDMISRANEVLNALLRLQKQQMAAQEEQRQVHFYNTPYAPPGFYVCLRQPTPFCAKQTMDWLIFFVYPELYANRKRRNAPWWQWPHIRWGSYPTKTQSKHINTLFHVSWLTLAPLFVYSKDPLFKVAVILVTFQRHLNGDEVQTGHVPYVMLAVYIMQSWNVSGQPLKPRPKLKSRQIMGPSQQLCNPSLRPRAPIQRQLKMIVSWRRNNNPPTTSSSPPTIQCVLISLVHISCSSLSHNPLYML